MFADTPLSFLISLWMAFKSDRGGDGSSQASSPDWGTRARARIAQLEQLRTQGLTITDEQSLLIPIQGRGGARIDLIGMLSQTVDALLIMTPMLMNKYLYTWIKNMVPASNTRGLVFRLKKLVKATRSCNT